MIVKLSGTKGQIAALLGNNGSRFLGKESRQSISAEWKLRNELARVKAQLGILAMLQGA